MPSHSDVLLAATVLVLLDRICAAAIPFHPSFPSSLSTAAVESSTCPNGSDCHTTWDIVSSCAATIFLCTWVSLHPSLPDPAATEGRVIIFQIMSWIRAFVFPENIAAWAVAERWETEQYESPFQGVLYSTPTISHQNLKKTTGWTPTHTYFALMGGFVETRESVQCF